MRIYEAHLAGNELLGERERRARERGEGWWGGGILQAL
jgi:hypothetical protein